MSVTPAWRGALSRHWTALALLCWTAVCFWTDSPSRARRSWFFFPQGARLLFSGPYGRHVAPGGLHLYANYPYLQIGPAAFTVAQAVMHLGPNGGVVAAELTMTAIGLATLGLIRRVTVTVRPELADDPWLRWTYLSGGAAFMATWEVLSVVFGHLDDCLALLFAMLALWAVVRRRPVPAGLALGLSVDSKPWALVFLPMLVLAGAPQGWLMTTRAGDVLRSGATAFRTGWRACLLAGAAMAAVIVAAWLPFVVADPGTLSAARYTIVNMPDSALRLLGVTTTRTPSWDRPAQVALGCLLGGLALWRRRWPAIVLLGVGARIVLDPAARGYYTAGVMLGALLWDLLGTKRPFPLWSLVTFCALWLVPLSTQNPAIRAEARLWLVVAFTAALLLAPASWYWRAGNSGPAETGEPEAVPDPVAT
ncbi:MAG TPA: hypothetical protein VGS19_01750 [Streptosporangiaceae bacterium]|nr:hypothetical protein [Streptosporangiaceae bacterium]